MANDQDEGASPVSGADLEVSDQMRRRGTRDDPFEYRPSVKEIQAALGRSRRFDSDDPYAPSPQEPPAGDYDDLGE